MSIEAMVWALTKVETKHAAEKLVLLSLANFAGCGDDPLGRAFPSVGTIARQAGCSERTVHRHLSSLENQGLIRRGDQSAAGHIRPDRRPVVWNLTGLVRGDNMSGRGAYGVTPVTERGDTGVIQPLSNNPISSAKPTAEATPPREDVEQLCQRLASLIENNGARKPSITKKWRDSARLLMDRDGVAFDDALALIEWCQNDPFWRTNILAMPTFRKQYDQLKLKSGYVSRPTGGLIEQAERTGDVADLVEETGLLFDFRWPESGMPATNEERLEYRRAFVKQWIDDNRDELARRLGVAA